MSYSSIPRMSNPKPEEAPKMSKLTITAIVLCIMMAVYIGFVSSWLISGDKLSQQAETSRAASPSQTEVEISPVQPS